MQIVNYLQNLKKVLNLGICLIKHPLCLLLHTESRDFTVPEGFGDMTMHTKLKCGGGQKLNAAAGKTARRRSALKNFTL